MKSFEINSIRYKRKLTDDLEIVKKYNLLSNRNYNPI